MINAQKTRMDVEDLVVRFAQIKSELRLKSHLFSLEARDVYKKLELTMDRFQNKMRAFSTSTKATTQELKLQSHLGVLESRDVLEHLQEDLGKIYRTHKSELDGKLDHVKVQSQLALMETEDYLEGKRDTWRKALQNSQDQGRDMAEQNIEKIKNLVDSIQFGG